MKKRILIVGGVAGGASCATRLRRLDETAEIVMFDRGHYVSFANCGLPYYVGGVIQDETKLLLADPGLFQQRFNIDVRVRNEVVRIDRAASELELKDLTSGRVYRERYDALVLSPGAAPVRPPLPGIDLPGIFVLRTIPDSREIRDWIQLKQARSAVIVGAGFIGLEMAENLAHRGLRVTVVEMLNQVLPPLDPEMASLVQDRLSERGVNLALGDGVAGFAPGRSAGFSPLPQAGQNLHTNQSFSRVEGSGINAALPGQIVVRTQSGAEYQGDLVILAIGVRPESSLAKAAGLTIGERGGIRVDNHMRTSDPKIWAVGDAVEVLDNITGQWALIPLAGPANRQGRIAADAICGRASQFRGVQATAICGVFGLTVGSTGASEKSLKRAGVTDYDKVYLHPAHHVSYYPGAKPVHLKLIFRKSDGRVLGAQAIGEAGVDKRLDVLAMAIQKEASVFDLEEAELCYAPQYGAAKDPVNLAGMIAANILRGDVRPSCWETLGQNGCLLLDVRDADEYEAGHIPSAANIPLPELRQRMGELHADQRIRLYCAVGQRAYYASRLLSQRGFQVENLSGGFKTYLTLRNAGLVQAPGTHE